MVYYSIQPDWRSCRIIGSRQPLELSEDNLRKYIGLQQKTQSSPLVGLISVPLKIIIYGTQEHWPYITQLPFLHLNPAPPSTAVPSPPPRLSATSPTPVSSSASKRISNSTPSNPASLLKGGMWAQRGLARAEVLRGAVLRGLETGSAVGYDGRPVGRIAFCSHLQRVVVGMRLIHAMPRCVFGCRSLQGRQRGSILTIHDELTTCLFRSSNTVTLETLVYSNGPRRLFMGKS